MTKSATYTITPMFVGSCPQYDKSILQFMGNYGVKVNSPMLSYLVQGNGKNILVDSGPGPQAEMERIHPGLALDFKGVTIESALAGVGVTPADIDYVIFTHLHWDHWYNGEKFPGKPFYVQKAEVSYAMAPLECHGPVYEAPIAGMTPPWLKVASQLRIVEGDIDIDDGIRLILTPGHSPGGQCVLVSTEAGPYLLAGDTIMQYENWEGNGSLKHLFSLAHVSLLDFDASLKKIEALRPAYILPGHDYKVLEHKEYPIKK
jgi:glyoxylase-like metal-dependent hydrolase (beta-lactamase superfamily II)